MIKANIPVDTPEGYRWNVRQLGSHTHVGKLLGVARETVTRRCLGDHPISTEASLALSFLRQVTRLLPRSRRDEKHAERSLRCIFN